MFALIFNIKGDEEVIKEYMDKTYDDILSKIILNKLFFNCGYMKGLVDIRGELDSQRLAPDGKPVFFSKN